MKRVVLGLAMAALLASAVVAQTILPEWALQVLSPGERAVHVLDYEKQGFNNGSPAFIIAASAEGDTLGGRVLTVWLDGNIVKQSARCNWVASDLSGSYGYVKVFDSITLDDARAAIEAARGLLLVDEYVWKVQLQEAMSIRDDVVGGGMFRTGAIGVCVTTQRIPLRGREVEVRWVSGALVATYNGRCWD
ncbi:MAG: hypothetical protein IPM94_16075 [bacterium]|nr:hypothetical protein [bacterium]